MFESFSYRRQLEQNFSLKTLHSWDEPRGATDALAPGHVALRRFYILSHRFY